MTIALIREWVRHFRLEILRPLRIRFTARQRAKAKGVFIGVTGSSGKSTTTDLITAILRKKGNVAGQVLDNTINPLIRTMRGSRRADFVVVEAGVAKKGQMATMASLLRPDIAVVTLVGLEHYSAFRSGEAIAEEKGELVAATNADGLVVLNADDPLVMGMAARAKARVVTFGYGKQADCRILDVHGGAPDGVAVRLSWRGRQLDIATRFLGRHFAVPVAAAAAVGLELGVAPGDICEAIGASAPLRLRLSMHRVPGGPLILADCAKAPSGTLHLAFEALRDIDAPRRRVVLGSISDTKGGQRKRIYKDAIAAALDIADEVILVTEVGRPKRFAPAAAAEGRYRSFLSTRDAAHYIARTTMPGEAILLKGSANYHLERVLLNLTGQVRCWEIACGRGESCFKCGLFELEHRLHRSIRGRRRWGRLWGRVTGAAGKASSEPR